MWRQWRECNISEFFTLLISNDTKRLGEIYMIWKYVKTSKSLHIPYVMFPCILFMRLLSKLYLFLIPYSGETIILQGLSLWLGKYDSLRWKTDLYRNKKRYVETYQIQSSRLSDSVPPAVTRVIVLVVYLQKSTWYWFAMKARWKVKRIFL